MLLSVVLPVRNGTPYIREAVASILSQSMAEFELIVVDNGSTDDTLDVVRSFRDPRIRIVRERRMGGPIAFNCGLHTSRGRYIARMDADDVALPDRFEQQLRNLSMHPTIGILGSQALKIDEDGTVIGRAIVPLAPAAIRAASRHGAPFIHPTLMFRREVWNALGGYREFSPGADYDMLLRALDAGITAANLPAALLKYRVRPNSVSHRTRRRTIIHSFAVRKMRRLRQHGHEHEERRVLDRLLHSDFRAGRWFDFLDGFIFRLTDFRNRLQMRKLVDFRCTIANASIVALSALHHQMARSLWSALRLKMTIASYDRRPSTANESTLRQ